MTNLRLILGAGLALTMTAAPLAVVAQNPPAQSAASSAEIEPEAVQALGRMSAYMRTLTAFQVQAETSLDLVMDDGQKVKLDGVNRYIVRRPDAFYVEVATDWKVRRLFYDGKSLTLSAPELGYYATVKAPGTIRETLDLAAARYGLHVPLQDLFRWTDLDRGGGSQLTSAMVMGPSKVNGVECTHYAFREADVDWQIWISKGDRPMPLKIVIVDQFDPTRPQFEAKLTWNTSPQLGGDTFVFRPAKDAKPIRLTALEP